MSVRAVLFDRDDTLIHDVPYKGDPELVRPVFGAAGKSCGACGHAGSRSVS